MNNGNGPFRPGTHKETPIEGEEAARHRDMYDKVSAAWYNLEQANMLVRALKIFTTVGLAAGAGAQYFGWFG